MENVGVPTYCSTRGGSKGHSFEEAISSCYAPGGGLFVPEKLPYLGKHELEKLNMLPFPDLAREILSKFISP